MTGGFLNRWSRRKADVKAELEPKAGEITKESDAKALVTPKKNLQEPVAPPTVTLEDVAKIDRFAPDFSAFMQPGVDPAVQQAALKKMFSDPHFNIMDGLDIYIDDYSKPDPIPLEMLKRMVQADTLNIFRKDPEVLEADLTQNVSSPSVEESRSLPSSTQVDLQAPHAGLEEGARPSEEHSANQKNS
jgi:hypothetical protein